MSIIEKLIQRWKDRKATNDLSRHPAISLAKEVIRKVWSENEISKGFSKDHIDRVADQMMHEVVRIVASPNPFMRNRERLAASVLDHAEYQVLVMEPAPAPDASGLRSNTITGELKSKLWRLSKIKNNQKIWEDNEPITVSSPEDLANLVQTRYRICSAWAELFQSLRVVFEPAWRPDQADWYRAFVQSMCANKEHHFRLDLKMPSVLDPDAERSNVLSLEHSLFFNFVRHGLDDPLEAWKAAVEHIEYENDPMTVYNLYIEEYPV